MDSEIEELQKQLAEKQEVSIFEKKPEQPVVEKQPDEKGKLINNMFDEAIKYQVANNDELKNNVLDTAKKYTETKMQTIATDVDTEHKEAVFNNQKDACESYGFNEKTTPTWAVKFMGIGYNIILAIWLFLGSFTFMPVIFVCKKIQVGIKKTWLAILIALSLYLGIVCTPILLTFLRQ